MKKKEVKIGANYAIRHSSDSVGRLSIIRIDSENQYGGWNATKLSTKRTIRIKSAAKLRAEVILNPGFSGYGKWITRERFNQLNAG